MGILLASRAFGQVSEVHDLVYTQGGGFPQTLDLYLPSEPASEPRPAIVFVHGGAWISGSKEDLADWGRYYAALGYACVSINYRLTPQHIWPAQIDDSQAAVRWLRKNAESLTINPQRIGAVGMSAGGHLVLMMGATDTLNDVDPDLHGFSSRVQAVGDYFGPSDFTGGPREWDPGIWPYIELLAGRTWVSSPKPNPINAAFRRLSPLFFITHDDPPTIVFQGDADPIVPVDQSRRVVAMMQSKGVPVTYYEFPGEGHGFSSGPFWTSVNALTGFLASHLQN